MGLEFFKMKGPLVIAPILRERFPLWFVFLGPVLFLGAYRLGLIFWDCPFHHLTGLQCPGCGMTRAACWLVRGDVDVAVSYHPFVLLIAAAWLFFAVAAFLPKGARGRLADFVARMERRFWVVPILGTAFFAYGLARLGYEVYLLLWR